MHIKHVFPYSTISSISIKAEVNTARSYSHAWAKVVYLWLFVCKYCPPPMTDHFRWKTTTSIHPEPPHSPPHSPGGSKPPPKQPWRQQNPPPPQQPWRQQNPPPPPQEPWRQQNPPPNSPEASRHPPPTALKPAEPPPPPPPTALKPAPPPSSSWPWRYLLKQSRCFESTMIGWAQHDPRYRIMFEIVCVCIRPEINSATLSTFIYSYC